MEVFTYFAIIALLFFALFYVNILYIIKKRRQGEKRQMIIACVVFIFVNIIMFVSIMNLVERYRQYDPSRDEYRKVIGPD